MDTPTNAKTAILQALLDGEAYGLEILARVVARTEGKLRLHQGSLYPALRSLEREGFLTSREVEGPPERGGRPRRYYELTAEGRRAAQEQRQGLCGLIQGVPVWSSEVVR